MIILANSLVILVALLHTYFLVLEMFLWKKPLGLKTFKQSLKKAEETSVLAANQGLYNGFLVAGLLWGLFSHQPNVILFFLGFVVVAGIFGGITAGRSILVVQALPGLAAFLAVWFS